MPMLTISTNVPGDKIPSDFIKTATKWMVDKIPEIPAKMMAVHIKPDQKMAFGGSTDPCALITLGSIGTNGLERNKGYSKTLMEILHTKLGIEPTRMYITFYDYEPQNIGYNQTTIAEMMKK